MYTIDDSSNDAVSQLQRPRIFIVLTSSTSFFSFDWPIKKIVNQFLAQQPKILQKWDNINDSILVYQNS